MVRLSSTIWLALVSMLPPAALAHSAFSLQIDWPAARGAMRVRLGQPARPRIAHAQHRRTSTMSAGDESQHARPDWRAGVNGQLELMRIRSVLWLDNQLDKLQGAAEYNAQTRFLRGPWEPVQSEHRALESEVVEGALPPGLQGVFLRIGPNPPRPPTKRHHVFDGEGMLHSLRIHDGKVLYSNALLETERMRFERELGESYFTRIGELYGLWGLAKALLTIPQRQTAGPIACELEAAAANTAMVLTPRGNLFALNEGGAPLEVELDWDGALARIVGFETKQGRLDFPLSAHPKVVLASCVYVRARARKNDVMEDQRLVVAT